MKKITMLAAMLAMVLVAAAPAMAQDVSDDDNIDDDSTTTIQFGDNIDVGGDFNTQFSQNVVGDIDVSASQVSGDQTAVGDGNIQVIAQDQDVSVSVSQSAFQFLNTGLFVIH